MDKPSLEQFPAWIQTLAYVGALLVGLAVAAHGYFKAWIAKVVPGKTEADGGKVVGTVMVLDRTAVEALTVVLRSLDASVRSCQDDIRRSHDRMDTLEEIGTKLIAELDEATHHGKFPAGHGTEHPTD